MKPSSAARWAAVIGMPAAALLLVAPATNGAIARPAPMATNLNFPLQVATAGHATYVSQLSRQTPDNSVITRISPDGHRKILIKEGTASALHPVTIAGLAIRRGSIAYTANGLLKKHLPDGRTGTVANLSRFEKTHNPDAANTYGFVGLSEDCRTQLDLSDPEGYYTHHGLPYTGTTSSLPYAMANAGGGGWYVADELANDVLEVSPTGHISVVYVGNAQPVVLTAAMTQGLGLPDCISGHTLLAEASPTGVTVTSTGRLLITLLPGGDDIVFLGPFDQWGVNRDMAKLGARGSLVRVDPRTGTRRRIADGLTEPSGVVVGPRGRIYVTEASGPVQPDGTQPGAVSVIRKDGTPRRIYGQAASGPPIALEYSRGHLLFLTASPAAHTSRLYSMTP